MSRDVRNLRGRTVLRLVLAETCGVRQDMCVTGEEWLRDTFDPALRTSRPPYEELRTELRALSESGMLSKDLAMSALELLDEDDRDCSTIVRERTERAVHVSRAGADPDRLEGSVTPERSLGEINGVTVVVMLIELWTSRLTLRMQALQSQLTDALDASFGVEWKAYERRWVEDRAAAEAEDLRLAEQPSVSRLSGLPLSVADDVGTRYYAMGIATGGSEHPWRSEWRIEPAVPPSASLLRIALEDGGPGRECLELALPSRT
jgi:hypothetical protein